MLTRYPIGSIIALKIPPPVLTLPSLSMLLLPCVPIKLLIASVKGPNAEVSISLVDPLYVLYVLVSPVTLLSTELELSTVELLLDDPPIPKNDPTADPNRDNQLLLFEDFLSTVV